MLAGQAFWARLLRRRIDRSYEVLKAATHMVKTGSGEETKSAYTQLASALDEFIRKTFNEWAITVDRDSYKKLECPLMIRSEVQRQLLDINFDSYLLKLFAEINYWEILMFEIPHYAADVYQRREELRNLREHVMLVVRDYNRIITELNQDEIGLFKERIKVLDKKVQPGLTKLTWAVNSFSDFYIGDCRVHASKVMSTVTEYKSANQLIAQKCRMISENLLVKINTKRVYEELQFYDDQIEHKEKVQDKLYGLYHEIMTIMKMQFSVFQRDGQEVYRQWVKYTERIDQFLEDAFRMNVKFSLHEISKAINGDGKSGPSPLFRVNITLEPESGQTTPKVGFSPTLEQLQKIVEMIANKLVSACANIRRLPDILTRGRVSDRSIAEVIDNDEETRKAKQIIRDGIVQNNEHLTKFVEVWDGYKEIWQINKNAFIKRYQRHNPAVSSFDADIARYSEVQNNIQKEETTITINFVLVDSNSIKMSLIRHCNEWQDKFTALLRNMATAKLKETTTFMHENAIAVTQAPENLNALSDRIELYESLHATMQDTHKELPAIREQFAILEKYEVTVEEDVHDLLDNLQEEWVNYQQAISDADTMIKRSKDKFKSNLLANADEFKKSVGNIRDGFMRDGPFSNTNSPSEALAQITAFRTNCVELRTTESSIKRGLGLFKIEQTENKELTELEVDLGLLESIWNVAAEWEGLWNEWKVTTFVAIETESMEMTAQGCFKKLSKLQRDAKDKDNWTVVKSSKDAINRFQRTMPLITDLKNPAMRDRHWFDIKEDVGPFEHETGDFTLEKIIELKLEEHGEKVSEVSGAASKELAIEESLSALEESWSKIELEVGAYKDRGHFILKAPDDIFMQLEDNQVTLATMKASRYVKAFEKTVDYWERALSHIMETIEMVLQVQRQWMYLENIFLGEDIRKQLPKESAEFDGLNSDWKTIMTELNKDPNAR